MTLSRRNSPQYPGAVQDVTQLLSAVRRGETRAGEALVPLVYAELRRLAAAKMARERPGQTLQPTALVHEAWLRIVDESGQPQFENRAHFFKAAAEAMRRILIERARRRLAVRHGGGVEHVDLDGMEIAIVPGKEDELLAVHEALNALAAEHPRKAEVVKLHYFTGLTLEEAADVLGISHPTAKRDWVFARGWLRREIRRG
jgi:RNA polymerase sigma factor (TIGR02999 family)